MSLNYKTRKIEGLEVLEVSGTNPQGPYVILLHGYGASAYDLLSLADELSLPDVTWLFPNAPIKIPFSPEYVGHAWFSIDMSKIELAMQNGKHEDFSETCPPGLNEASQTIIRLIKSLNVPLSKIVLGGFSQGAMVTCDVAFQLQEALAGIVILSGSILDIKRWEELIENKKGHSFFISHGTFDPILNFEDAKKLEKLFHKHEWKGELVQFEGGHTIPYEVIEELESYLRQTLHEAS